MPLESPVEVITTFAVARPSPVGVKFTRYVSALLLPGIKEIMPAGGFIENAPGSVPPIGSMVTISVLMLRPVFSMVKCFCSEAGAPFFALKFKVLKARFSGETASRPKSGVGRASGSTAICELATGPKANTLTTDARVTRKKAIRTRGTAGLRILFLNSARFGKKALSFRHLDAEAQKMPRIGG
jgi:hypothetical protein